MTPNGRELSGTRSNESSTARSAENSMLAQLAPVHRRVAPMNAKINRPAAVAEGRRGRSG